METAGENLPSVNPSSGENSVNTTSFSGARKKTWTGMSNSNYGNTKCKVLKQLH